MYFNVYLLSYVMWSVVAVRCCMRTRTLVPSVFWRYRGRVFLWRRKPCCGVWSSQALRKQPLLFLKLLRFLGLSEAVSFEETDFVSISMCFPIVACCWSRALLMYQHILAFRNLNTFWFSMKPPYSTEKVTILMAEVLSHCSIILIYRLCLAFKQLPPQRQRVVSECECCF